MSRPGEYVQYVGRALRSTAEPCERMAFVKFYHPHGKISHMTSRVSMLTKLRDDLNQRFDMDIIAADVADKVEARKVELGLSALKTDSTLLSQNVQNITQSRDYYMKKVETDKKTVKNLTSERDNLRAEVNKLRSDRRGSQENMLIDDVLSHSAAILDIIYPITVDARHGYHAVAVKLRDRILKAHRERAMSAELTKTAPEAIQKAVAHNVALKAGKKTVPVINDVGPTTYSIGDTVKLTNIAHYTGKLNHIVGLIGTVVSIKRVPANAFSPERILYDVLWQGDAVPTGTLSDRLVTHHRNSFIASRWRS